MTPAENARRRRRPTAGDGRVSRTDRPHLFQQSRDAMEDPGLVYDDRTDSDELMALHVEPVTAS